MKAFKLMMMAGMMAFATAASAQGTIKCLTAEDVVFGDGETTADLVVNIDYTTDKSIVSWGFNLYLPDGIEIEYETDTEIDKETGESKLVYYYHGSYGKDTNPRPIANLADPKVTRKDDGGYLILGYSDNNAAMKSLSGMLITLTLTGSDKISGNGEIKNTSMAYLGTDGDGKEVAISADQGQLADYTFKVNDGGSAVGINDINAAETSAPAYNLQGVRVNDNAKGLIIRDGKKMVVK